MVPWCLESESPAWALEKLSILSASLLSPLLVNNNPSQTEAGALQTDTHRTHRHTYTLVQLDEPETVHWKVPLPEKETSLVSKKVVCVQQDENKTQDTEKGPGMSPL